MGTPKQEGTHDYSRSRIGIYLQGSLYADIPTVIFLTFPVWGPHDSPLKEYCPTWDVILVMDMRVEIKQESVRRDYIADLTVWGGTV